MRAAAAPHEGSGAGGLSETVAVAVAVAVGDADGDAEALEVGHLVDPQDGRCGTQHGDELRARLCSVDATSPVPQILTVVHSGHSRPLSLSVYGEDGRTQPPAETLLVTAVVSPGAEWTWQSW